MDKKRKIKCDCGGIFVEKQTQLDDGIVTKAMICDKCDYTTLTTEQAKKYVKLKELHEIIDAKRKIIKIGNSMGLTLPDKLHSFGAKVGKTIKTEALTENSFKVEFT
ncbi:hypothetical protein J4410_04960 [Candidatus Woesearchaeota archaeon]|nr:hypothetical protein [Candidatus Woesearchaeota archaeon]